MSKIRTAFDLANERIIESNYKPIDFVDDRVDFGTGKDTELPDFILDWKNPNKDINKNKEVEFVTWDSPVVKPKTPEDLGIKIQKSNTYHYEDNNIIDVFWHGPFEEYNSTCRAARSIIFRLGSENVKTKLDIKQSRKDINDATKKELEIFTKHEFSKNSINIYHECLPQDISENFVFNNNIAFSNICNSELFSELFSESTSINTINTINTMTTITKLNKMREIWVTSNYGKNIMEKNGVKVPIYVIPYGVDQNRYSENSQHSQHSQPFKINIQTNKFIFLSIFKWEKIKNFSILLKSFMNEFNSNDDVSLLILTKHNSLENLMKDFDNIRKTINKNDNDLPHIVLYDKIISEKDMPGLYSFSNAYVSLSAKNSSLTFLESSLIGKPIISGKWGVQTDFLTEDNSFLIKNTQDILEQIQKTMRFVFENYEIAKEKNKKLQNVIKKYSWENTVKLILERLNQNKE